MRLGGKVFLLPSRITLPCKYQQFCVCHHSWNLLPWLYFLPCSLVGKRNVQPIVQGAGVTGRRLRLQPLTPRLPFHPLCKALSLIQALESRFVSHHRLENRRLGGCQALKKDYSAIGVFVSNNRPVFHSHHSPENFDNSKKLLLSFFSEPCADDRLSLEL